MNEPQDALHWAEQEFGQPPKLENRLRQRLVKSAALLAQRPSGSLPQRMDFNELQGFYRLMERLEDQPELIQHTHRQRTRERMIRPEPVLIIHDSTQVDYTTHRALRDKLGPIGDGGGFGFLQHNSIAIDPQQHEILGLIHQQTFVRQDTPEDETRAQRQNRPDKESKVWVAGIRALGMAPTATKWIDVCDSGADFFEVMATSRMLQHHFLIRLYQNRRVLLPSEPQSPENPDEVLGNTQHSQDLTERIGHLLTEVRALEPQCQDMVMIQSKGGRPSRLAQVCLAAVRLRIAPPVHDRKWKDHPAISTQVIRVWEPNPPAGEQGLEWILGTDLTSDKPEDLKQYRDWYCQRWATIEEYHKVQKTGCGEEDMRFETAGRMQAAIALISVIAIRLLNLRWQRDGQGDADASTVASEQEITVVRKLTRYRGATMTVRQFVDGIAKLGGYLGRKHDGPPGWQSLWRGYQRLADILLGMELMDESRPP